MLLSRVLYEHTREKHPQYPFSMPWLQGFEGIEFDQPVTFLVGENGIGKSTFIEALAMTCEAIQLTNQPFSLNPEYEDVSKLAEELVLHWHYKTKRGMFFRADDFITFIRQTEQRKREAEQAIEEIEVRNTHSPELEKIPYLNTLAALDRLYPVELQTLSHGQSFLALFKSRLVPKGLYLLDEPETPLSPQNQLSLMYLIHEQVKQGSQFIISTHSPILTAYPDASILELSEQGITPIKYEDMEHVQFMTHFMSDPKRFMHYTLQE